MAQGEPKLPRIIQRAIDEALHALAADGSAVRRRYPVEIEALAIELFRLHVREIHAEIDRQEAEAQRVGPNGGQR